MPSFNINSYSSASGSSSKDFLVVVAIIGVIIVAALAVYSVSYLYQMAKSGFQCQAWRDFGIRYSYVQDQTESQFRSGNLTGAYFTSGYIVPFGVMGLTGEIGYHSLLVGATQTPLEKTYQGTYLLVGPSFIFPFQHINGHAFAIELLAGTSTEKGIGLMSTLRFGFDFKIAPEMTLGINLGAALINIKEFESYVTESDELNYLSGGSMSYRW